MPELVLFDLDGTLADTAPDLGGALNELRAARGLSALPLELLRPAIGAGTPAMLAAGFELYPAHPDYPGLRSEFLARYAARLADQTRLFPGVDDLLDTLDVSGVVWGIVTNKPARFTDPLVAALGLARRAACVVSGDTLEQAKPHPAPLLHAAALAARDAHESVYLGDAETDMQAATAAGMRGVVAGWGYLADGAEPARWGPTAVVHKPGQFASWVLTQRAGTR